MMRFDDSAADNTTHWSVEFDRRHVLIHIAHPDPIGRIERQVIQAKQELTITGFRDIFFFKTQDVVGNVTDRPFAKPPDAV